MKRVLTIVALLVVLPVFAQQPAKEAPKAPEMKYVAAEDLMIINKGFENTELTFSRLPVDKKGEIRKEVWDLGLNSAGVAVRFNTNSKKIGIRWTLLNNFNMPHMAGTGIRGIDLYYLDEHGEWHFTGTAQPKVDKESERIVVSNMDGNYREYMAYLPLYDGVTSVSIGVTEDAELTAPKTRELTKGACKPIVFYGTSITQGGCASRPGMVYTSIISRERHKECVNLGFSGNARMDFALAECLARIDADSYVIACLENCTKKTLQDSAYKWLVYLAKERPEAPIYMVENIMYTYTLLDIDARNVTAEKNAYWRKIYERLVSEGYKNFVYIDTIGLTGPDYEGSVDGAHQTDLGFLRMSEKLLQYIK